MADTQRLEERPAAVPAGYGDGMHGTDARTGAVRRVRQAAALGVVALAVLGYASFEFVSHVTASDGRAGTHVASTAGTPSASASAAARGSVTSSTPRATTRATVPSAPPASHPAQQRAAAPQSLVPASVAAFGPGGTADGDNPQNAGNVVADPASGWQSDWYTTASFGGLKDGTGLLLDMGRTVTITSVRLTLGGPPGARLELRLGAVPSLAGLRVVTTATTAGDLLTLRLRPVSARYVLLWFTRLPPDGAGTYQVSVYRVTVDGRR